MKKTHKTIDLSDIYKRLIKYRNSTILITVVVISVMFVIWAMKPVSYRASVLLDVTRIGQTAETQEYEYDGYYRLQADEQFAETVAHWLKTPRVVEDIIRVAAAPSIDSLHGRTKFFSAQRVSPQSISVEYTVKNPIVAKKIADAISEQINIRTSELNYNASTEQWFAVRSSDPVIQNDQYKLSIVILIGLILGCSIGMMSAIVRSMRRISLKEEK